MSAWHSDTRDEDTMCAYELYVDRELLLAHGEWAHRSLEHFRPLPAKDPRIAFIALRYGIGPPNDAGSWVRRGHRVSGGIA